MTTFDAVAEVYDEVFSIEVREHYLRKRLDLIRKAFPGIRKILDAGCGTGILIGRLRASGYDAYGIDVSPGMVRIAERRMPGRVCVASVTALPYPDGFFDLVISVATLHHLGRDVARALGEMARVTREDGHVLIWDHNPFNPYWHVLMRRVPQDTGEEQLVSYAKIKRELEKNGVKITLARKTGFVPDFAPKFMMPFFTFLEKGLEAIPVLGWLLAHNIVIGEKAHVER